MGKDSAAERATSPALFQPVVCGVRSIESIIQNTRGPRLSPPTQAHPKAGACPYSSVASAHRKNGVGGSASVMLGSCYVHKISKSRHRPAEFEDPVHVFKIESDAYYVVAVRRWQPITKMCRSGARRGQETAVPTLQTAVLLCSQKQLLKRR
jgi:hypothetical protein